MVDPIRVHRPDGRGVGPREERPEVLEALKHGSIFDVFKHFPNLKLEDYQKWFADREREFRQEIVQTEKQYSDAGEVPPPSFPMEADMHDDPEMTSEEREEFVQMLTKIGERSVAQRALTKGASRSDQASGSLASTDGSEAAPTLEELADDVLTEADYAMEQFFWEIMDRQIMADVKQKSEEAMREAKIFIEKAKRGEIGVEWVLIALAKVNTLKNGALLSGIGKKAFHVNESLNRVSAEVAKGDALDFGKLEMARSRTREGSFQMQMLMTDMQKIMGNIASTLEQVQSSVSLIKREQNRILSNVNVR